MTPPSIKQKYIVRNSKEPLDHYELSKKQITTIARTVLIVSIVIWLAAVITISIILYKYVF